MMKQALSTLTEHIFPGIGFETTLSKTRKISQENELRSEIIASSLLQMSLFLNISFFPVWLTTIIVTFPLKYEHLPELNKIILVIALLSVVPIEIARLYMGYVSNLKEKIPGLAGFWVLSMLLQAPMQVFLLHPALQPTLVEYVTQTIMCFMLAVQLIKGFTALHAVAKQSSDMFYVSQFFAEDENYRKRGKS